MSDSKIETRLEEIQRLKNAIYYLEIRLKEVSELYKKSSFNCISTLNALSLHFDIIKSGYTHRNKILFADCAQKTIETQIERIKAGYHLNKSRILLEDNDLPF